LSYHGKNHYNSVVPLSWSPKDALETSNPGVLEDLAMDDNETTEMVEIPPEDDEDKL
jgi:hypothetical protein